MLERSFFGLLELKKFFFLLSVVGIIGVKLRSTRIQRIDFFLKRELI